MKPWQWVLVGLALMAALYPSSGAAEEDSAEIEFFEKRIRPVLVEHCYECHSQQAKNLKGSLSLDSRAGMLAGGDSGPAITPADVDQSLLIAALRYDAESYEMPPQGKLSETIIADFVKWIRMGAPAPSGALNSKATKHSLDMEKGRNFWSFQPPRRSTPPPNEDGIWNEQPIDGFVLEKLKENGLSSSPPASKRTLIRRAYFDLLGLPPTPDEIDRFLNDNSADAYERLIDRLLASPHYGQRWGRYWLDLTRYTDSTAGWLNSMGQAWLYRDWVVAALNQEMPYDQFIRRQLATDLMDETGPEDMPALGFLGLSPTYWKELKLDQSLIKVVVAEEWEERIDAIGRTFLGLSLACARCHDHKFDPIEMEDYYALAGVLASSRLIDRPTIPEPAASAVTQAHRRVKEINEKIAKLRPKSSSSPEVRQQVTDLQAEVKQIKRSTPQFETSIANAVIDESVFVLPDGPDKTKLVYKPGVARDLRLHIRGNPSNLGPIVPRRFLTVLSPSPPQPFQQGSGRLELANALVDEAAPLTARVMVNRVWRHHFGRGLVETPSDFGSQGARPSHPKLLDDLTARFTSNGWSIKWLHRQIMLSATYRQVSDHNEANHAIDPDNRWLWRMNRRRLDIEAWRDAMLSVSGRLDPALKGPSVNLDSPDNRRRTIYGNISRRDLNGLLRLYDFPDPTSHTPGRDQTTTPLQQLFVLNSPFIQQQSAALADRLLSADGKEQPIEDAIHRAYLLLVGREVTDLELSQGLEFLKSQRNDSPVSRQSWAQYLQVLLGSNEFMFID